MDVHIKDTAIHVLQNPIKKDCSCVVLMAGVITSYPSTRQELLLLLLHYRENAIHSWQSTRPSWLAEGLQYIENC